MVDKTFTICTTASYASYIYMYDFISDLKLIQTSI